MVIMIILAMLIIIVLITLSADLEPFREPSCSSCTSARSVRGAGKKHIINVSVPKHSIFPSDYSSDNKHIIEELTIADKRSGKLGGVRGRSDASLLAFRGRLVSAFPALRGRLLPSCVCVLCVYLVGRYMFVDFIRGRLLLFGYV